LIWAKALREELATQAKFSSFASRVAGKRLLRLSDAFMESDGGADEASHVCSSARRLSGVAFV
jgi:hypothetical protein